MLEWAYRRGVNLHFVRPGRPVENAFAERFIHGMRDEGLNENWFITLKHARDVTESRRKDYNEGRLHTSLGRLTPKEFAESAGKL